MSEPTVLHYLGYDVDRGGIVSVIRALERERRFGCVLGVNPGFRQMRTPPLPIVSFSPVAGETIGLREFWKTRKVAHQAASWLAEDRLRIFHGHSRAGLLVAGWMARRGETRVIASVHCYGRQRGFYRWMARSLGERLYWLTPAMRRYYGAAGQGWEQCIPACAAKVDTSARPTDLREERLCTLGGIGTLVEWKGWHLIVNALAQLTKEDRDRIRFRHIGGPEDSASSKRYAEHLYSQTRALGLDTTVEWRGPQPSAETLLSETDILVVASENEPCSVAMLEALQRGVPVLAADSGGALDVIEPPTNGWLFRTGDVTSLARAITRLADPAVRREARVAPASIDRFLASHVAEQWTEVYGRLKADQR